MFEKGHKNSRDRDETFSTTFGVAIEEHEE
jgi:hypothetical protein